MILKFHVLVQPWALSDFVVIQHGQRLKEIEVYFVSNFFFLSPIIWGFFLCHFGQTVVVVVECWSVSSFAVIFLLGNCSFSFLVPQYVVRELHRLVTLYF